MGLKTMLSGVASAGIAVGLLGGCGTASRSGPDPVPTWSCTADGSGEACTEAKAAAQAEEAEAYAEAMHAYREFTKERNRAGMSGGVLAATPVMERYAAGEYLAFMVGELGVAAENGLRSTGELVITKLEPHGFSAQAVTILACEDARDVRIVDVQGVEVGSGTAGALLLTATGPAGERRISAAVDSEEISCP